MALIGLTTPKWTHFLLSVIWSNMIAIYYDGIKLCSLWHMIANTVSWLSSPCVHTIYDQNYLDTRRPVSILTQHVKFMVHELFWSILYFVANSAKQFDGERWPCLWGDVGDVIPSEVCCNITLFYVIKLMIVMICRTLSWPAQLLWIKLRRTWNLFYVLQEGGHVFHQIIVSLQEQPQGHRGQTWVTDMSGSLSSSVCMSRLLGDACMTVDISIHPPPSLSPSHPPIHTFTMNHRALQQK